MALYPQGDKLDAFPSRYVLANLAARRAKQIRDGAPILVETKSTHPLTIALEEIAEGAVKAIILQGEVIVQPGETLDSIDLLAREAGGFDTGFGDIGALLGGESLADTTAPFVSTVRGEPAGGFEEETISLDDLLDEEEAGAEEDSNVLELAPEELDIEEDEALLD